MKHISAFFEKYRAMLAAREGADATTRSERMCKRSIKRSKYKTILQRNYDGTVNRIKVIR